MSLVLDNVSRYYEVDKKRFYALKDIKIVFPETGLISIVGNSGCGKSTLLNMLSGVDKPSEGHVYFNGYDINKFSKKERLLYLNNNLGIVFQSYNLLEKETALQNIILPMQIMGKKKKEAVSFGIELLKYVNLSEKLMDKKVNTFSGGEKQRISIARALANKPKVILADEPTGALDSKNSIMIMELLKKISKDTLVVLVSHDRELVDKYSDDIIELKDGKIVSQKHFRYKKEIHQKVKLHKPKKNTWSSSLALSNLKNRKGRNIISALSLGFSLIFTFIIVGFSIGSKVSTSLEGKKQFDYGMMNLSYETSSDMNSNGMSLVKKTRPTKEDIVQLQSDHQDIVIDYDYSYFFSPALDFALNDNNFSNFLFSPVYSFNSRYVDHDLLIKGLIPKEDLSNQILINEIAYKKIKNISGFDPLNNEIFLEFKVPIKTIINSKEINDNFMYQTKAKIVGVVEDFSFLATPKIYHSYLAYKDVLTNLKIDDDISYFDLLKAVSDNDPISSYGLFSFLKNIENNQKIKNLTTNCKDFVFYSDCFTKEKAFLDLMDAATIGLSLFLVIALLGTALIIGIISFSAYSDDKKEIAILYVLGANKNDVLDIYLYENLFLCLIAIFFSVLLSPILSVLGNKILENFVGVPNLISPLIFNISTSGLLPSILIISLTVIICFLATWIPIKFASGIKLKDELKDD